MPLALALETNPLRQPHPNSIWKRGTQIRTVQSHVITAVETGRLYESEIEMLRKALKKLEPQKGLPFIADICLVSCTIATLKGYGRFLEQPHLKS